MSEPVLENSPGETSSSVTSPPSVIMDTGALPDLARVEARGISKFELFTTIPNTVGGFLEFKQVYIDSFPSDDDQSWMPPLHGDDVASLADNVVEELAEQRHDYTQFTRILEAHGCPSTSIDRKCLLCFQDETELHHFESRCEITPQTRFGLPQKSTVAAFFHFSRDEGRIVRPSTKELERCLDGIPEADLSDWKNLFKSLNDEAVGAVKIRDWETACEQFKACLVLLENMEDSIGIHTLTWLSLWICIPLVDIYHLRLSNFPQCVTTYDQMLQQLNREMAASLKDFNSPILQEGEALDNEDLQDVDEVVDALTLLYYTIIWHRRLVLFEWSYRFEKDGDLLLAKYVRSQVFSKIKVRKIHYAGFVQLQRMINYWGRRIRRREGDMRVALCCNLEHLYRDSEQNLKSVEWTQEKWRWIRDETHELKDQWKLKLEDVMSLFVAGMKNEARSFVDDLGGIRSTLPPFVGLTIDHWNAKFLMSDRTLKEAERALKTLRKRLDSELLTKQRGTTHDEQSSAPIVAELLARVQWDLSKLTSRFREAEMLEHTPFKVEMIDWSDENDSFALSLMEDFKLANSTKSLENVPGFNSVVHLAHGQQLLNSLGKRFPATDIEKYRERLHDATKCFEDTLRSIPERENALRNRDEVISHEEILSVQRRIERDKIVCHQSLGLCFAYAHLLKPRGVDYNRLEDLQKELPVFDEACLENGIKHLEISLHLATQNTKPQDAFLVSRIAAKLGWIHFAKVKEYHDRVQKFISMIPEFRSQYFSLDEQSRIAVSMGGRNLVVKRDCGNPCHSHYYLFHVGLYELKYNHMQGATTQPFEAFEDLKVLTLPGYRSAFGLSDEYLTDEHLAKTLKICSGLLLRALMLEVKRSSDYIKRSVEMGYGRIISTESSSNEEIRLVPSLSMVETTKKIFTLFQRLMVFEQNVRVLIKDDELLQSMVARADDDLTASQRALLWAERGRSRSLMLQLLPNKLPQEPIHNTVNFNMTDQEAWEILRATQLSYGENTVFVEYTFDATHEFVSDVIGTERSSYDWKSCSWIVYVVTKDGTVHMRSYHSKIPATSVALIHKCLSEGGEAKVVEKHLEELYDAFISPISDLLRDMKPEDKLVFALDEVLTNVPFPILRNSETGKYLFENHTISFTPALWVLGHCNDRHKSLQGSQTIAPSVALGDPAYPPKGRIQRLPHTYHEVWGIPPFFNDGCVKILTGTEATAERLLSLAELPIDTVQGFVHVAAHGFVDKDHKSGSLQLAYSSIEQGPPPSDLPSRRSDNSVDEAAFELEELEMGSVRGGASRKATKEAEEKSCLRSDKIMQCGFEWRSHMVVLSACNSAKGYVLGSEGVVGLPRAFLVAGVPCIVATQWSLEDRSSSELMQEFYREMSQGGRDASSALRAAMLCKMKLDTEGSLDHGQVDVYKWGGYLVWGSPTVTLPPSMIKHRTTLEE